MKSDLLKKYMELRDDITYHTDEFHDAMSWDIEGYLEELLEGSWVDEKILKKQVNAFESILKGLESLEYVYS